ncbi:GAF and ANTAR domain-containing protein [Cellulomonas iranensis]|uniref:GAF and ANTAR domain-containing protein n=1 Tax=Cellulomonas iranensis TaxID=76862 RepID=UPI000B3D2EBE|nr:GAF and ANTAR domain-containing protein [Cellulomonas iranensis]
MRPGQDDAEAARTEAFAELARMQPVDSDSLASLHELLLVARRTLPGVEDVSLTLGEPDAPTHVTTTSPGAARADGWQVMAGEGPSFDAYRDGATVTSARWTADPRWPRVARHSETATGGPATAVPVQYGDRRWGVLTCYGDQVHTADQVEAVELVAGTVAAVLTGSRQRDELRALVAQLGEALESRATIDQAKGVIMAHRGGTPDDAFDHLSAMSQHRNVKLREVARDVVQRATAARRERTDGADAGR